MTRDGSGGGGEGVITCDGLVFYLGEIENKTRLFHAKETAKSSGNDES